MTAIRRNHKGGFTLVEILIVVIILGILAAIVIPQFTSASQDARKNSLTSQLQTIRSQYELYKLQHLDNAPAGLNGAAGSVAAATAWAQMTAKTDNAGNVGTVAGTHVFGPYLQAAPTNPLNGSALVLIVTADVTPSGASGSTADGFIINKSNGKIWGTSAKYTKVYNEANPADANNDL
jgi:general secretion pathway protein G